MCESGSRKRKNRHDSPLETTKTVKAIFEKDDLDDSMSTSDWGLFIDEEAKRPTLRRGRGIKLTDETLYLVCEWDSCALDFSEYESFEKHLKMHLENVFEMRVLLKCCWTDCEYTASCPTNLKQHACYHAYHTRLKSIGSNVLHRNSNLPKCTQMEKFIVPSGTETYICEWEYCGVSFETIYEFFQHIRMHINNNPKSTKEGPIQCGWKRCTSTSVYTSQSRLAEHVRIHTKEKIIACPTCGHLFANNTKFCDHRRRQLPINMQSYLCSQCSKYFASERLLKYHMRTHINHYKCSMCEMTCPKPSVLAKHIRFRHVNEKPYQCSECDYRCVAKHNLDFHIKTHDAENEYKCSDCDFECRSAFGLDIHSVKEHGKSWNNVYECHNCQKRFIRGGLLTKHLMKVHNYVWPSGHSRFRYKEDHDGIFRLQTVRYETLDVTQEIIKAKPVQQPRQQKSLKFDILKKADTANSIPSFDIVISTKKRGRPKSKSRKKVLITIDDIDIKGNIVKSQTIHSREIICSDESRMNETDNCIVIRKDEELKSE